LTGTIRDRYDAAVITISSAVEDHARDSGRLRALRDQLADFRCTLAFLPLFDSEVGYGGECLVGRVVHELRIDVLQRAKYHEARTLGRSRDSVAHAKMPAETLFGSGFWNANASHLGLSSRLAGLSADYFAGVLDALAL